MRIHFLSRAGVVLAAGFLITACGSPEPAEPKTWAHPDGLYSFDYPGDWTLKDDGGQTFTVVHAGDTVDEGEHVSPNVLQCSVTINKQTIAKTFTQAELNDGLGQMKRADFDKEIANRTGGTGIVHSFSQTVIDGITATRARYEIDIASTRVEMRHVHFWLPGSTGIDLHTIACGGPDPLDGEDGAAFDVVLHSLRFGSP